MAERGLGVEKGHRVLELQNFEILERAERITGIRRFFSTGCRACVFPCNNLAKGSLNSQSLMRLTP